MLVSIEMRITAQALTPEPLPQLCLIPQSHQLVGVTKLMKDDERVLLYKAA